MKIHNIPKLIALFMHSPYDSSDRRYVMAFRIENITLSLEQMIERLEDRPGYTLKEARRDPDDNYADFQLILENQHEWRRVLEQVAAIFGSEKTTLNEV